MVPHRAAEPERVVLTEADGRSRAAVFSGTPSFQPRCEIRPGASETLRTDFADGARQRVAFGHGHAAGANDAGRFQAGSVEVIVAGSNN